jgi:hypothetical protein
MIYFILLSVWFFVSILILMSLPEEKADQDLSVIGIIFLLPALAFSIFMQAVDEGFTKLGKLLSNVLLKDKK